MATLNSGSLAGAQRGPRVLVVDDEENLNWGIVTSLRREQYAADGALTAEDARRRMTDLPYDCVISDIQMPGIDGFQLLTWIREQRPQVRVIMMTAFGSASVRQEALRSGVAAYLEKPFDLSVLKHELRKALETPARTLSSYDLIEITQVINLSRRDVAVQAQVQGQLGMLVFERGELISAAFGALRGEQAFFAMCATPAQLATPAPTPERVERNVTQPVSALIFDALLKRETGLSAAASVGPTPGPTPTPPPPSRATRGPITASLAAFPQTGSLARDPQRVLAALVTSIARPCAVALVLPDGTVLAQAQTRQPSTPDAVFAQLLQGFIGMARAAQMGQWGMPREARLLAAGGQALVRLIGQRAEAPALIVIVGPEVEQRMVDATLAAHEAMLLELAM